MEGKLQWQIKLEGDSLDGSFDGSLWLHCIAISQRLHPLARPEKHNPAETLTRQHDVKTCNRSHQNKAPDSIKSHCTNKRLMGWQYHTVGQKTHWVVLYGPSVARPKLKVKNRAGKKADRKTKSTNLPRLLNRRWRAMLLTHASSRGQLHSGLPHLQLQGVKHTKTKVDLTVISSTHRSFFRHRHRKSIENNTRHSKQSITPCRQGGG